jgi:hypothetical protein
VLLAVGAIVMVLGGIGAAYLQVNKPRPLDVDGLLSIQTSM